MDKSGKLDAKARQGALLDAAGHSIAQIKALVGVSESTVSRWRKSDEYKKERERLEKRHVDAVQPLLERIKTKVVEGAEDAVRTLREALEATDDEGYPLWNTRLEAARTLKAWKEKELELLRPEGDGALGGGGSVNIIVAPGAAEGLGVRVAARPQQVPNLEDEGQGQLGDGA